MTPITKHPQKETNVRRSFKSNEIRRIHRNNPNVTFEIRQPQQLLHNGHFIYNDGNGNDDIVMPSSEERTTGTMMVSTKSKNKGLKRILWTPHHDTSSYPLVLMNIFKSIFGFGSYPSIQKHDNHQQQQTDDVEIQQSSLSQLKQYSMCTDDGLYDPSFRRGQIIPHFIGHSYRSSSRIERDGINVDGLDSMNLSQEHDFVSLIRPQDIKITRIHDLSEEVNVIEKVMNIGRTKNHTRYALEVVIDRIKLHNHPFMIDEEREVNMLEVLYDKFISLNDSVVLNVLETRLNAIINEIKVLHINCNMVHKSSKATEVSDDIYLILYHELVYIASKIVELESDSYSIFCEIVSKWDEIVKLREMQGFQSTTQMLVKNLPENSTTNQRLISDVNELRKILRWFTTQILPSFDDIIVEKTLMNAIETLSLAHTVRKTRADIFLTKCEESTLTVKSDNVDECRRRKRIQSNKYYAQLIIDGQKLETTHLSHLNWPSMEIKFNRISEVILNIYPSNVSIKIYLRKFGCHDTLISNVHVIIPENKLDFNSISLEFMAPVTQWYHFMDIGGDRKGFDDHTKGSLLVSTRWKVAKESQNAAWCVKDCMLAKPSSSPYTNVRLLCYKKDKELRQANDRESNDAVLMLMKPSLRAVLNNECLRFTAKGTKHSYHNYYVIKEPMRHQLLKQRKCNHDNKSRDSQIVLNEWDIVIETKKPAMETKLHSRLELDLIDNAAEERPTVDPKNIKTFLKRLRKVRKTIQTQRKEHIQGLEDFVHDASVIKAQLRPVSFDWIINKVFPPRNRSLFPAVMVKEKSENGVCLQSLKNARLVITVINANNVQWRQDQRSDTKTPLLMSPPPIKRLMKVISPQLKERDNLKSMGSTKQMANSFARVKFKDQIMDTKVASGDCPFWEQAIEIPLFPNDGQQELTPLKMKEVKDDIVVTLFDKVELDFGMGGGYYDDEQTTVHENRFLGFVKVPFPITSHDHNVFGHVVLETPDILLGYRTINSPNYSDDIGHHKNKADDVNFDVESQGDKSSSKNKSDHLSSIKISISVEPRIGYKAQEADTDDQSSNESPLTIEYTRQWMKSSRNINVSHTERIFRPLVQSINGKTWLINRFLVKQNPPSHCRTSMHRCAHFVSLIPSLKNWNSFQTLQQLQNIWLPTQTCLDIIAGNQHDHAVLLTNYFLFLSYDQPEIFPIEVYLTIGSSSIGGNVAYVITRNTVIQNTILWDPLTGKSFMIHDERCPECNIGILVSIDNIYANIQPATHPSRLNFDLNRKSDWIPFYDKTTNRENYLLNSCQGSILMYTDPDYGKARELEVDLLDKVKVSIRGWRRSHCSFNADISSRLRHFLEELEESKQDGLTLKSSEEYLRSLIGMSRGKTIFGFPLHFGYTNVKDVLDRVEMTSIHQSKHPDAEFAAAVKVFPYECGVYSVWVFLCALSPDHFI